MLFSERAKKAPVRTGRSDGPFERLPVHTTRLNGPFERVLKKHPFERAVRTARSNG